MGTVLLGLFIHGFIVLPIIFSLATRSLPFRFIANMGNPLVTALVLHPALPLYQSQSLFWRKRTKWIPRLPGLSFLSEPPSTWTAQPCTRRWQHSSLPR